LSEFLIYCSPNIQYRDDGPLNSPPGKSNLPSRAVSRRVAEKKRKRRRVLWIVLGAIAIIAVGVAAGVGVTLSKKNGSSSGPGGSNSGGGGGGSSSNLLTGTDGSVVTMQDGTKFTYSNKFGGDWALNPKDPFAPGGKAQSWSPRIGKETWTWGSDVIRGVNLG